MRKPRQGKRGQSAMSMGAFATAYTLLAPTADHCTSWENVSRPRSAPHCVGATMMATPPAGTDSA